MVLSVQNVIMGKMVRNMSFSVFAGEITGISGLIGSGRTEIAKVIAGALKRNILHGGMIYLNGKPIRYRLPRQAIADGIVYVTEDRKLDGFFETMRIDENIYTGRLATPMGRRMLLSHKEQTQVGNDWSNRMNVRAINSRAKIVELSGGNQQKVVVAKSLVQEPKVVFFDEPTRGVDVGAIQEIHDFIRSLAAQGIAVVVISSYLPEILSLSDRILVARQGRIVEEFAAADATEEKIMYAAIH
jgi:ABC-type sugar transport system ATPase subunit